MPKVFTISKQEAKRVGEENYLQQINELGDILNINPDIDDIDFQTAVKGYAAVDSKYAGHTADQFEKAGKSLATLYDSYKKIWIFPVA